jgi:hypothetical protein
MAKIPKSDDPMKTYTSFSGADIIATFTSPTGKNIVIGELSTISYSIHREKFPVRALGNINARGFTSGYRTIAGTMVFTVFDRHALLSAMGNINEYGMVYMMADEMPPFDITISFINEYGHAASMTIYGITIVDEGQVMSIQDIMTENTISYMASGIDTMSPMDHLGNK